MVGGTHQDNSTVTHSGQRSLLDPPRLSWWDQELNQLGQDPTSENQMLSVGLLVFIKPRTQGLLSPEVTTNSSILNHDQSSSIKKKISDLSNACTAQMAVIVSQRDWQFEHA